MNLNSEVSRSISPSDAKRAPTPRATPATPFREVVEALRLPLSPSELEQLEAALTSNGSLDLSGLSPAATWALDALWDALCLPDAPKVTSIRFAAGMPIVPEGVRQLPFLEDIELPEFNGSCVDLRMQGERQTPLAVKIGVPRTANHPSEPFHILVPLSHSIDWLRGSRPLHCSISRCGPDGLPEICEQLRVDRNARKAQQEFIGKLKRHAPQQIRRFLEAAAKGSKPGELTTYLRCLFQTTVNAEEGLPLLHHLQRASSKKGSTSPSLVKALQVLQALSSIPKNQKVLLLAEAVVRHGHPTDEDRQLLDQVADLLDKMPDGTADRIDSRKVRLVATCLQPLGDGMGSQLHHWLRTEPDRFSEFINELMSEFTDWQTLKEIFRPDSAGRTVLHVAASLGWPEAANHLVSEIIQKVPDASDVFFQNLLCDALMAKTADGDTLLWHAAARGREVCDGLKDLIQLLLAYQEALSLVPQMLVKMFHIDTPRPHAGQIVRSMIGDALNESTASVAKRMRVTLLADIFTRCPDSVGATELHQPNGEEVERLQVIYLLLNSFIDTKTCDSRMVLRYLLVPNESGDTALHHCALTGDAKTLKHMIGYAVDCLHVDLTALWNAQDHQRRTPFWATVHAGARSATMTFLKLASLPHKAAPDQAFGDCIATGIQRASEADLGLMLSACDGDGRSLLHALAHAGHGRALAFVVEQVLSSRLAQQTKADLLAQALKETESGSTLLGAVAKPGVLNALLGLLLKAGQLSNPQKEELLLVLMTMSDMRIDRRMAFTPVLIAVNRSDQTPQWKASQLVLIDLLMHEPASSVLTQLHRAAGGNDPGMTGIRLRAWMTFFKKQTLPREVLASYLHARDPHGKTAFELAVEGLKVDASAAFLKIAAADPLSGEGDSALRIFVTDSIALADEALLTALLAPDGAGRTVFHAAAAASDGKGPALLLNSLQACGLDTDTVVSLLATALARRLPNGKTMLGDLASTPSADDVLRPMLAALDDSARWSAPQKKRLWEALATTDRISAEAPGKMLALLSTAAGDRLPTPIAKALTEAARPVRLTSQVASPSGATLTDQEFLTHLGVDIAHVLNGEVNAAGEAVGGHWLSSTNQKRLRIHPGSAITLRNGETFEALVDIKRYGTNQWIAKVAASTFFPSRWRRTEVLRQIASALRGIDAGDIAEDTPLDRRSDSGLLIRFCKTPAGTIICYPLPD